MLHALNLYSDSVRYANYFSIKLENVKLQYFAKVQHVIFSVNFYLKSPHPIFLYLLCKLHKCKSKSISNVQFNNLASSQVYTNRIIQYVFDFFAEHNSYCVVVLCMYDYTTIQLFILLRKDIFCFKSFGY